MRPENRKNCSKIKRYFIDLLPSRLPERTEYRLGKPADQLQEPENRRFHKYPSFSQSLLKVKKPGEMSGFLIAICDIFFYNYR